MKRSVILLIAAALVVSAGMLHAQSKFDETLIRDRLDKLKTETEEPAKSDIAATWISLGKVYYDVATIPSAGLYKNMDEVSALGLLGTPESKSVENIDGTDYMRWRYKYLDVYLSDGRVASWINGKEPVPGALGEAVAAYMTAYGKDSGVVAEIKPDLMRVADVYKERAENNFIVRNYADAAFNDACAYDLQRKEILGTVDTVSGYNAGYLYVFANDFENAEKYLKETLANRYEDKGDVYYYLYFCYFNQKEYDQAKQVLLDGIAKYPQNDKLAAELTNLYTTTGEKPDDVLPILKKVVENSPANPVFYCGMGCLYDRLGESSMAIDMFKKTVALVPDDFTANCNLGLQYVKLGDQLDASLVEKRKRIKNQGSYDAELKKVKDTYAASLVYLEKAYQVNPKDANTLSMLKRVYFRLRDESPAYMANFNKYDALFKAVQ